MLTAEIREKDCVGCSRCIKVCPVDAIVGANKFMHTILTDECIGCKLCLKPCPTDCIEMIPLANKISNLDEINKLERAKKAKQRYIDRTTRLQKESQNLLPSYNSEQERKDSIKNNIAAALARAKN